MTFRFGIIAFLILIVGALTFAFHTGEFAGSVTLQTMALLMGVSAAYFLIDSQARKLMLSGVAPYQTEPLTFDTKFDDLKVSGRIVGKIGKDADDDKLKF